MAKSRIDKLEAALRENLKRRKAQAHSSGPARDAGEKIPSLPPNEHIEPDDQHD